MYAKDRMNRDRQKLVLALLLVCLTRVVLVGCSAFLAGDDGNRYLQEAVNLHDHQIFSQDFHPYHASVADTNLQPTFHDMPLYPAILAGFIAVFHNQWIAAYAGSVINCFIYTAAAFVLNSILVQFGASLNQRLFAVAIFAISPESLPYSVFYMPDSLFVCLLLLAVYALIYGIKSGSRSKVWAAFGLLGLSCYAKPAGLFFGAVFGVVMIADAYFRRRSIRTAARICVLGLLLQGVVIAPWMARNYIQLGSIEPVDLIGGMLSAHLHALSSEVVPSDATDVQTKPAIPDPGMHSANRAINVLPIAHQLTEEIRHNPLSYLKVLAVHHSRLYAGTGAVALLRLLGYDVGSADRTIRLHDMSSMPRLLVLQLISWAVLVFTYFCAIRGGIALFGQRAWLPLFLALAALGYFAAVVGPVAHTRYRLPMLPFFALLSAYAAPRANASI